ncbi:MAG: hypothetical protein ACQETL_18520 [Bacteroidota bacterium]
MFEKLLLKSLWKQLIKSSSSHKQHAVLMKIQKKGETVFLEFVSKDWIKCKKALEVISDSENIELKNLLSNCIWKAFFDDSIRIFLERPLHLFFKDSSISNKSKQDLITVIFQRMKTPKDMYHSAEYLYYCDSSIFELHFKPLIEQKLKYNNVEHLVLTSTLILLAGSLGKKASSIKPILEHHLPFVENVLKCDIFITLNQIENTFHPAFIEQFCDIVSKNGTLKIRVNSFPYFHNDELGRADHPYDTSKKFIGLPLLMLPSDIYSLASSQFSKIMREWKRVRISWDFIEYCLFNDKSLMMASSNFIFNKSPLVRGLSATALRYPKGAKIKFSKYINQRINEEDNPIVMIYLGERKSDE